MVCRREAEMERQVGALITGGGKEETSKGIEWVLKAKACVVSAKKRLGKADSIEYRHSQNDHRKSGCRGNYFLE